MSWFRLLSATVSLWVLAGPAWATGPEGLLAEWNFDEGQGDVAHDSSGNGHHAKIHGARWVKQGNRFVLSLDGLDDYVDCGKSTDIGIGGPISIEAWIRPMREAQGETVLFGESYSSYVLTFYNVDICLFYIASPAGNNVYGKLTLGQWNHVVATFDGDKLAMWINGRLVGTRKSKFKGYRPAGNFMIGTKGRPDLPKFKGMLGGVRVYGRALSAEEVHERYRTTVPIKGLTVAAQEFNYAGDVAVNVDLKGLGDLPDGATAEITLGPPGQVPLHRRSVERLESWGQVEVVFHVGPLTPGRYEVTAVVRDAEGRVVGEPGRTTLRWPKPPEAEESKRPGRRLNNLVRELLNISGPQAAGQSHTFRTARAGYLYIAGSEPTPVTLSTRGAPARRIELVKTPDGPAEAMCFVSAGVHTIRVAKATRLVVRSVPELIYSALGDNPQVTPYGPFNLEFLNRYVLSNVNCLVVNNPDAHRGFLRRWRQQGKRAINDVSAAPYFHKYSAEKAYAFWTSTPGMTHPLLDGIIVNEFSGSEGREYEAMSECVRMIFGSDKYRNRTYYLYCSPMWGRKMSEEFIRTVIACGGKYAIERYLPERPTLAQARLGLDADLVQDAAGWDKHLPGSVNHMIVCFGHFLSAQPESINTNPSVDFKVYTDMQFNIVANHPHYSGVYGIMEYTSAYADVEYVRWASRLFRHYAIEGNTEMLSQRLGYRYELDHVRNPDFQSGTDGWRLHPAEPGTIAVDHYSGYGFLQGRYPKTIQGDTFLRMKRSEKAPNAFAQTIRNLKPGRLYCLKMFTGDFNELVAGKSERQSHAVTITIGNVDLLPERCFDHVFANCYTHHVGKFNEKNRYWMNLHERVFRPRAETAEVTVSDWASEDQPGGPIGQELMFSFIEVQPYFD